MIAKTQEAYLNALRTCLDQGYPVQPRGKLTLEVLDMDVRFGGEPCLVRGEMDRLYANAEIDWYMGGSRNPDPVAKVAKLWDNCRNPDGTVNSNYGRLVFGPYKPEFSDPVGTEWAWARNSLLKDKDSRQAIMVYHLRQFHWEGNRDVPCTLTESFLIRENNLQTRVHMRSSDLWYGLPFDLLWHQFLHTKMLRELRQKYPDLGDGGIRMRLDSAHLYDRHIDRAKEILANPPQVLPFHLGVGLLV